MDTHDEAGGQPSERLTLVVEGRADSDLQELAKLTGQLRRQLLELDVEDVRLLRGGEIPRGAKIADPVAIGGLLVTLGPAAIQGVVGLAQHWLKDRPVSGIKLTLGGDTIELTNASPEQVEQLTRAFIARSAPQ